jgi:predicted PurR-regulated permease PerM
VLSALLVAKREGLQSFTLGLLHPRHREQTGFVLDEMWNRLGRYVRAKLIVMVIVGGLTFGALELIGVRYPLLLSVIVAFGELIPQVGPWIARVPLFAVAALGGGTMLLLVVITSLVIENLKGYLISPAVEGSQLDIDPLVVILAVLVGGALLGPLGALVAVPAAACVQVVCEEVVIPWRRRQLGTLDVDETDDVRPALPYVRDPQPPAGADGPA